MTIKYHEHLPLKYLIARIEHDVKNNLKGKHSGFTKDLNFIKPNVFKQPIEAQCCKCTNIRKDIKYDLLSHHGMICYEGDVWYFICADCMVTYNA